MVGCSYWQLKLRNFLSLPKLKKLNWTHWKGLIFHGFIWSDWKCEFNWIENWECHQIGSLIWKNWSNRKKEMWDYFSWKERKIMRKLHQINSIGKSPDANWFLEFHQISYSYSTLTLNLLVVSLAFLSPPYSF